MPGAELGLAVVGTVDLCFKCVAGSTALRGRALMRSPGALSFAGRWKPISLQLQFLWEIWSSLDEEHQHLQDEILHLLVQKLQHAVLQISKVEARHNKTGSGRLSRLKQWKYAFTVKECLHSAIDDLKEWQATFDPSWYLIIRVASPLIDVELARPRQPSETALSVANRLRQALTTNCSLSGFPPGVGDCQVLGLAHTVFRSQDLAPGWFEFELLPDHPIKFCLLECFGVVKNQDENTGRWIRLTLSFGYPGTCGSHAAFATTRARGTSYSLSDVFAIAKRLALSVSYVHIMGFVHKNIQPETVMVFDDGMMLRHGDAAWDRNLYRHSDWQGLLPDAEYTVQHDVYSLGVCVLEIGLWRSLVAYDPENGSPSLAKTTAGFPDIGNPNLKDVLITLATDVLRQRIENKFAQVVINCLTCMDESNRDFGDKEDFQDEDGVLIGVKYIERVGVTVLEAESGLANLT
ncbi:hypothetical protein CNMCM8927_001257 [Aspergillus lentulus]|uniref:Protein kinase domain-containing protein n=1 Tax=Aspergillus lentulus TaxID=293939 RepID=A0AAN5YIP5_ASPLE|nr:hypothetical protein CNMCM6069_000396 [Aspergillus lentulus]KAF4201713.1 hypothetical protein CNMCM8927_001257 [Aspergillus lentulus]